MKTIAWLTIIGLATILLSASICQPYYLSDDGNEFFKNFVTHELLSVLGVIVTITLASAASLHLEFNKLEEQTGEPFKAARSAIKMSSYSLIAVFGVAFILVMAKPWIVDNQHASAALNSFVILLFLFSLAILADLTVAVFRIPAIKRD